MRVREQGSAVIEFRNGASMGEKAIEGNESDTLESPFMEGLAVDTAQIPPYDLYEVGKEPFLQGQSNFRVEARSSAILLTDEREVPVEY
jgi:hypothetical protein